MSNDEEMDELDLLTNPAEVKKAVELQQRPMNRPPFVQAMVDIANIPVQRYTATVKYGQNEQEIQAVNLRLTNFRNVKTANGDIFSDDEYDFQLELPYTRDGKPRANPNAEIALMVDSASKVGDKKVNSIRHFPGLKNVVLVEKTHKYTYQAPLQDEFGETVMKDGRAVFVTKEGTRYFYEVQSIGNASAVAKAQAEKEKPVSEEAKAIITQLIADAGDTGISVMDLTKAAMKVADFKKDDAAVDSLSHGEKSGMLADLVKEGKILQNGDTFTVAG